MITGIVVALPEELSTLTSRKIDKGSFFQISDDLMVAYSGTGSFNAKKAAELLISRGSRQLLSWGCAAALDPSLKSGDLTIPECLLTERMQKLPAASNWHHHVINTLSPHFEILTRCLAESRQIVTTSKGKSHLYKSTGCLAVDMESAAIAEVSDHAKIPFLAIRSIADSAQMSLPDTIAYSLNEHGEIELKKLLGFLTFHPYEIPALIKLGMDFNKARNKLKSVANFLDIIVRFDKKTVP